MQKVLIATNNPGKRIEFQALLEGFPAEVVTPAEIGLALEVEETGTTYSENAALKGVAFAGASGLLTLADDSGLEVDALDGRPGLHSARFSPLPGATDRDRRLLLLQALGGRPRPWTARFRCVVAVVAPGQAPRLVEGICPGEILEEERGAGGFGYDPLFWIPEAGATMAELGMQAKNRVSHRGRAVRAALPILLELLGERS
jgi:XTP/dITP diphosphohydrolase